jgi:proteasome accessory factor A
MELGNFIVGADGNDDTCRAAARTLLKQISGQTRSSRSWNTPRDTASGSKYYSDWYDDDGYGGRSHYGTRGDGYDAQDWCRKYLRTNGGCTYIDLDHLEVCTPEVVSAYDCVAAALAMFRIARQAKEDAEKTLPAGQRIQVLANNSDGQSNSYGSHLNFLMTRQTGENIFHRRMHYMLFLATYQVSSIVFAGAGKVGGENGVTGVPYQISARADFMEALVGQQTTYRRPIVNSRDEALCGSAGRSPTCERSGEDLARLHVIFYDNNLCHVATLLKVGVMQIILAMIECERIDPSLILDDPISALRVFSHDPTLQRRARTVDGKSLTAVELQFRFFEGASRFVAGGGCDRIVPRARDILALWCDTLTKLQAASLSRDVAALAPLAPRLDWVLKLFILRRAMEQHPGLSWDSPQIKHMDQLYASLDPQEGLYWGYERAGFTERLIADARIEQFVHDPPADTRAWGRAMLLRHADPDQIADVEWDSIRFNLKADGRYWPRYRDVNLGDPLSFTRNECEPLFRRESSICEVLDALELRHPNAHRPADESDASERMASDTDEPSFPLARVEETANPTRVQTDESIGDILEQDVRRES